MFSKRYRHCVQSLFIFHSVYNKLWENKVGLYPDTKRNYSGSICLVKSISQSFQQLCIGCSKKGMGYGIKCTWV